MHSPSHIPSSNSFQIICSHPTPPTFLHTRNFSMFVFLSVSHRRSGKMLVKILPRMATGDSKEKKTHCFSCSREHVKIIITNPIVSDVTGKSARGLDWNAKKESSLDAFMINVWQIMAFSDWSKISCKRLLIYLEISHSGKFMIKLTEGEKCLC